jgi:hypothetical protein
MPPAEGLCNVGIAWAGKPSHKNDRNRTMSFEFLLPLCELPNVRSFSLQKGEAAAQLTAAGTEALVQPLGHLLGDFADTAAVVNRLDLVITVDTALAHLAGALGRPVWTLLPYAPDWRWMYQREDSPWYPTMRLFRQTTPGDWPKVIARVRAALARFASG